jgi:allantoate deiminase
MGQLQKTKQLAAAVIERCRRLASFSENSQDLCRTFLSPPMRDVHREITGWLSLLNAHTRIDAAGNLHAIYSGTDSSAPRLLIGSHLDTVPNAGAYDGMLGVVLGVALVDALEGKKLPYAIELIGFSEEEGVRFGIPFIGSRALVGRLDEELLGRQDSHGTTVRKAIEDFGLNPAGISREKVGEDIGGYLEFHIEQGPVLENLGRPLAAVDSIAGQTRMNFVFTGRANHAGTTPMNLRFDAMAGAAEWITTVERIGKSASGLVATVGRVETKPGATNVIAGEVVLSLDVRHASDELRRNAVTELAKQADDICQHRGLSVRSLLGMDQSATAMDPMLTEQIEIAIKSSGCEPHRMVSGAGHDAMIVAEKVPSAMIFLRTPGGISHHPSESVSVEDVEKAIECGLHLLGQLCSLPSFQPRTCRA